MRRRKTSYLDIVGQVSHMLATTLLVIASLGVIGWTIAAALGQAPWLEWSVSLGGTEYPQAGSILQIVLSLFMLSLLAYLPSAFRVQKLERSHRDFSISMSDVMEAYAASHNADRAGVFTMSQEFDAVKERIEFLRDHPDLGNLEPKVLEAAAEMSFASRDLAEIYSDKNVTRAQTFLKQRQQEIEQFNSRIEQAKARMHELRRWVGEVEIEESVMESQLSMMESEFGDVLAEMGFYRAETSRDNLYPMPIAAE